MIGRTRREGSWGHPRVWRSAHARSGTGRGRSVRLLVATVLLPVGLFLLDSGAAGAAGAGLSAPSFVQSSGILIVGKAGSLRIRADGFPAPMVTESGVLPPGVSFTPANRIGLITGTPAPGTGNDYYLDITATNSQGSVSESYDLTVEQREGFPSGFCPGPFTVGQYGHYDQTALSYPQFFGLSENSDLPDGLSFTGDDNNAPPYVTNTEDEGWLSGTPQPGSGGKYSVQYSVDNDDYNAEKYLNCQLVVDEAPTFTDGGTATVSALSTPASPAVAPQTVATIEGTVGYPRQVIVTPSGTLPSGMTTVVRHDSMGFEVYLKARGGAPPPGSAGAYLENVTVDNGISSSEGFVLVVQPPGASPQPTALTLSTEQDPVTYGSSAQTYTATVSGGTSPTGYVQFSLGGAITTVPLNADDQASFTTPADLDVDDYTVTATYTGDGFNASSTASEDLTVDPATTSLALTGPTSTANGTSVTFTATVSCDPACGTTPTGYVDFYQDGDTYDTDLDLVGGQATLITDPTMGPGLANEVDATFYPFSDAPGDFAPSPTVSDYYDIGSVDLATSVENDALAGGIQSVADGGTVTVDPTGSTEISAALSAVDVGNGVPPGPLSVDITVGSTDETATLIPQDSTENGPGPDPGTRTSDYYWTISVGALSAIAPPGTGSASVTVSSPGSDNFVPDTTSFTLDW